MSARKSAAELFETAYGCTPKFLSWAPSRVNIIGEHTDYNEGFVLPMALPFKTVVAVGPSSDRQIRLTSKGFSESSFSLDDDVLSLEGWARYVGGMAHFLEVEGVEVVGFNAAVATTVPIGAGLSSSAALEIAAGQAIGQLAGVELDGTFLAQVGQQVENEIIGVASGIMDQFVSATAVEGSGLLIDCRTLESESCPIPDSVRIVVMDTVTRRELERSSYGDRRAECESAREKLRVRSLRDATVARLDQADLPSVEYRRAKHVITENARTQSAAVALHEGDVAELGRLMNASHESLRDDFEVSSVGLDAMVDAARSAPGCMGARMTGGGFGGCAVGLVESHRVDEFVEQVGLAYLAKTGLQPDLWAVSPAAGAAVQTL